MKKDFICYVDMDGVLNLFESDPNARKNMWTPGYFLDIPVRDGISALLEKINKESKVIILSKVIDRIGVCKEKNLWIQKNISSDAYSDIIYVPWRHSKSEYMFSSSSSMLIDDNEQNLAECEKNGCHGLFLSDVALSKKYPNAKSMDDIWKFYIRSSKKLNAIL